MLADTRSTYFNLAEGEADTLKDMWREKLLTHGNEQDWTGEVWFFRFGMSEQPISGRKVTLGRAMPGGTDCLEPEALKDLVRENADLPEEIAGVFTILDSNV